MFMKAHNMLTKAGYTAVGHDRYSRVEWHMRENCLNGWPWGGILTTGAGCFMGYLQKFTYSNLENINDYMETVTSGKLPISQTLRIHHRRHDATHNVPTLPPIASQQETIHGEIQHNPRKSFPQAIEKLKDQGLIEIDDNEVRLTKKGNFGKATSLGSLLLRQKLNIPILFLILFF